MIEDPTFKGWRWGSLLSYCAITFVLFLSPLAQSPAQPSAPAPSPRVPAGDTMSRQMRLGVSAGLQWSRQHTTFNVLQSGSDCGQFQSGTRNQAGFEVFFETPLTVSSPFWFVARAGYTRNMLELFSDETSLEARKNGETFFVTRRHHFTAPADAVRIGVGAGWELLAGVRLIAAPTVTLLSPGQQMVMEEIVDPPGAEFTDTGGNVRVAPGATEVEFKSLIFGVDIGIGERIPIGTRLALHPELRASFGFGSIAQNVDWSESGYQLLLGVSYDFARRREPPVPPVIAGGEQGSTPAETLKVERPKSILRATIVAKGEDEKGNLYDNPVIEIEEAPWVESVPVVPFIFFDSASATVAGRYVQLREPEQADRFRVDSLIGITPLDIHWQLLNVVGERMRSNPAKRLMITGSVSSDEATGDDAAELGRARARAVAGYLSEIWRIDPERISVRFDPSPLTASPEETLEGREENRRAEIRFSDEDIAKPVVIHRLATIASPPAVRFFPRIVAQAPVDDWYVTVVQGDKELLRFEGSGEDTTTKEKQWSLGDLRVTRDLTPIRYRLTVRDSLGQVAADEGEFRVVERLIKRGPGGGTETRTEVAEYSIVGFPYSSADLQPRHMAQLQDVASMINDGADVTITGFTDRVGDAERNRQLSLDRARAVQSALRAIRARQGETAAVQMAVRGVGNELEVFNNDIPEGRLLSRMVRVTISKLVKR